MTLIQPVTGHHTPQSLKQPILHATLPPRCLINDISILLLDPTLYVCNVQMSVEMMEGGKIFAEKKGASRCSRNMTVLWALGGLIRDMLSRERCWTESSTICIAFIDMQSALPVQTTSANLESDIRMHLILLSPDGTISRLDSTLGGQVHSDKLTGANPGATPPRRVPPCGLHAPIPQWHSAAGIVRGRAATRDLNAAWKTYRRLETRQGL
ncbi:hypothetical protein B0T09DRAFT_78492 [Sordaria sp. MPI-SDFR-AT-0083]|nr:hypothetical protein B0T09DRAFT_78492 [Sordaria sp. MPI-SDFR-AT-0083]